MQRKFPGGGNRRTTSGGGSGKPWMMKQEMPPRRLAGVEGRDWARQLEFACCGGATNEGAKAGRGPESARLAFGCLEDAVGGLRGTAGAPSLQAGDDARPVVPDALGRPDHLREAGVAGPVVPPFETTHGPAHIGALVRVMEGGRVAESPGRSEVAPAPLRVPLSLILGDVPPVPEPEPICPYQGSKDCTITNPTIRINHHEDFDYHHNRPTRRHPVITQLLISTICGESNAANFKIGFRQYSGPERRCDPHRLAFDPDGQPDKVATHTVGTVRTGFDRGLSAGAFPATRGKPPAVCPV